MTNAIHAPVPPGCRLMLEEVAVDLQRVAIVASAGTVVYLSENDGPWRNPDDILLPFDRPGQQRATWDMRTPPDLHAPSRVRVAMSDGALFAWSLKCVGEPWVVHWPSA